MDKTMTQIVQPRISRKYPNHCNLTKKRKPRVSRAVLGERKPVLWRKVTKRIRQGVSLEGLAAYIVKRDPDFEAEELVRFGYLEYWPYTRSMLWNIRSHWTELPIKGDEERFTALFQKYYSEEDPLELEHEPEPEPVEQESDIEVLTF